MKTIRKNRVKWKKSKGIECTNSLKNYIISEAIKRAKENKNSNGEIK